MNWKDKPKIRLSDVTGTSRRYEGISAFSISFIFSYYRSPLSTLHRLEFSDMMDPKAVAKELRSMADKLDILDGEKEGQDEQ